MLIVLPWATLLAQLKCPSPVFEYQAAPEDEGVIGEFRFTNEGKRPVTLTAIRSSCGCLTAVVDKPTLQPREKGTLTARFDFGRRTGVQEKQIAVCTDDPRNPVSVFTMRINIPALVRATPASLVWSLGEARKAKSTELVVDGLQPLQVSASVSGMAPFVPTLKVRKPGREYILLVTPQSTAKPVREAVRIEVSSSQGRFRNHYVEVMVGKDASHDGQGGMRQD